jgi:hypothetical protein
VRNAVKICGVCAPVDYVHRPRASGRAGATGDLLRVLDLHHSLCKLKEELEVVDVGTPIVLHHTQRGEEITELPSKAQAHPSFPAQSMPAQAPKWRTLSTFQAASFP